MIEARGLAKCYMIMGLDRPDAGEARIGGKGYGDLRWPLREVGAPLEAKAFHPGRTARVPEAFFQLTESATDYSGRL